MDVWTIAREVDADISANSKGDPIRAIKTDTGYLKLSGDVGLLQQIFPGAKVRHGPVKVYGKSKFAALYEIEQQAAPQRPAFQPPAPGASAYPPKHSIPPFTERPFVPPAAKPAPAAAPSNGHQAPGVPTWQEYKRMAFAAQDLARMLEDDIGCDPKTNDQFIDRSQARVAIVQSVLVAFREGKVQAPKEKEMVQEDAIPGADAPFPEEDELRWRA